MLIQKTDILCNYVLRKPEERVRFIIDHIELFYDEFKRFKKDKQGNKRKNKPQYVAQYGEYWSRIINPPKTELKTIQKRINAYLVEHIQMPNYAFGGIKGKDNILNARYHKGQKYVFQTDLKDFFPFVTNKMVYEMFVVNGFSPDVASLLTKLTTFKGHLPQGAPTSTTIANLVFGPCGQEIMAIAEREGLRFTTFVDDVTISSQQDFKAVVPEILETIQPKTPRGFKISHGKTSYKSGITDITGVKMLNNTMTITDKLRTRFEAEEDKSTPRAKGMLNYAKRVKKFSMG
jgi:RNA-directed DNA polymerase